jgi:cytochrome b
LSVAATVRLWDWPVRLVHWGMVLLIPAMWWTAKQDFLEQHRVLGLTLLALIVFRLIWGMFGSETARFSYFLRGPKAVVAYLRGASGETLGHNPLGGWSVAVLLLLISAQLALGLVAQDEYAIVAGPLNHLVSYETAEAATEWHEALFNGIAALIALHILAVLFYQFGKRRNLIGPMLTGRKAVAATTAQPHLAGKWTAWVALLVALAIAGWIAAGMPPT